MPPVRSSAFKCLVYYFKLVAIILLLNKIIPTYSCCVEKGLVYIIIIALFSYQPSFYTEYIKLNICFSYNIYSVFNTKCIFLVYFYPL